MSISHSTKEVADYNEQALQRLAWAIKASQGQFSLIFAHCNYTYVQQQMTQRLREICSVPIREIVLKKSDRRLYAKIRQELGDEQPGTVIVLGLESVDDLDKLLAATNQVREEFRKNFHFPLLLWINDQVQTKLLRVAPDFESWGTSKQFQTPPDSLSYELIYTLSQKAKQILVDFPDYHPQKFLYRLKLGLANLSEFESAWQDLQDHDQEVEPELEASFYFMLGRNCYASKHYEQSLEYYQKSLKIWQRITCLDWEALVLFHMGLCSSGKSPEDNAFERCVDILDQGLPLALVNKFITQFSLILQRSQRWQGLETLAQKSLNLHQKNPHSIELAQDYGFLAEVALAKSAWTKAKQLAEAALSVLEKLSSTQSTVTSSKQPVQVEWMQRLHRGWYWLLLAIAEKGFGQYQESIKYLERAKRETQPHYDPELYIRILANLREVYLEQSNYLAAFTVKQERIRIEQQFGLKAFVGAGRLQPKRKIAHSRLANVEQPEMVADEIIASGRQKDINNLLTRIGNTQSKLTVIHGQSGVGKSSLIYAGLVPILQQRSMVQRDVLPITIRVYTDWVRQLGKSLVKALKARGFTDYVEPESVTSLVEKLRRANDELNLLTVLIFDQFEESFFPLQRRAEQKVFFDFLKDCIDHLLHIKVILLLNENHLHYLLQFERSIKLETIKNILSKDVLYHLEHLSLEDGAEFIRTLTNKARFYLEPELIKQLVNDLAGDRGEIRPIELQILGYQLQVDNITTLEQYQESGSHKKLLTRFLQEVIADCGPENESAAQQILYSLTDENYNRLLKTRAELASDLKLKAETIDLILEILESSGLVLLVPEHPADRYQLVNDYLVTSIRRRQGALIIAELEEEKAKLEQEKGQRRLIEVKQNRLINTLTLISIAASLIGVLLTTISFFQESKNSEIKAINESSEALYNANRESLDPLIEALRAGRQLKSVIGVETDNQTQTLAALQQAVYGVRERNRLEEKRSEAHRSWINSVNFSPDGKVIATSSADGTITLWHKDGEQLNSFQRHTDTVNSVSFSPDGLILATGSADGTVKLWSLDGEQLDSFQGHTNTVNSLSFSPDGQILTTSSADGTVKLWSLDGKLLLNLQGHTDTVNSVSFSPDGKILATSSADGTVKLWSLDGKLLLNLQGHTDTVNSVGFSPDGQILATGSADGIVKLWSLEGELLKSLPENKVGITSLSFSPDGKIIATGSLDGTVKLWSREAQELETFRGNNRGITSISFSPDGKTLATASRDLTVRLWSVEGYNLETKTLFGHYAAVDSVSFSPDGKLLIATASFDGTVKLWKENGTLSKTLQGDENWVNSVSFSPDGKFLASASVDGTIRLWNLTKSQEPTNPFGDQDDVYSVKFNPDGKILAIVSTDGTVKLGNLDDKTITPLQGNNAPVNNVSFSPDGKTLATVSLNGTLQLWNLTDQEPTTIKGHISEVNNVSFSPDGKTLATVSLDGTIRLWNLTSQDWTVQEPKTIEGYTGIVNSVSFSPDGTILASGSSDGTVKLWSRDGKPLQTLQTSGAAINSVSFSPDGNTLATASDDRTVILWKINLALNDLDELLMRGCNWAGDYLEHNPNVSESDRTLCESINENNQ
ncbi:MAG: hypothetical protein F6K47_13765 [Symploca sp. SIO2E6]|nr:hypothetical protein [Symploca sp. SIO2E6]